MTPLEQYQRLKQAEQDAQRRADKAQGTLERIEAELKKEFGVGPREAKKLLDKLNKEAAVQEKEFEAALNRFRKNHPGILD